MSDSGYYVSIKGETFGPAGLEELSAWVKAGSFSAADFVWDESTGAWIEAARIAALARIFDLPPSPAAGVESVDELSPRETARAAAETAETPAATCVNHEDRPGECVCPHCKKTYCRECLTSLDGLQICLDCIVEERGRGTAPWKRRAPFLVAGSLLAVVMAVSYVFLPSKPASQSAAPEKITIPLGEAPDLPEPAADTEPAASDSAPPASTDTAP